MSHDQEKFNGQEIHSFACDHAGCDEEFRDRGEFLEVWEDAKKDGWSCRKIADEWRHFCPDHRQH